MNTHLPENKIVHGEYARKSSESEDKQVQSIETQIEVLSEIEKRDNLTIYQPVIEERQSAFSPGRTGFNELVKLTYDGKVQAWLCYHANRLSRNPVDAGTIIHLMDIGKLNHIITPSRTYYNTPTDKMMLMIEFTMSKKDSDDKSVFVKDGLERRYKKGLPTGKAPIGFLNDKSEEKGNRGWLVDSPKLEKVELILKRFLLGRDSLETITEYARQELCLRTVKRKRQGGALITRSGVHSLLTSPIYAGYFSSQDTKGNSRTMRELSDRLPRVISLEQHERIINLLRRKKNQMVRSVHRACYTGIMSGIDGAFIGADHKFQLICDCKRKFSYRNTDRCPDCLVSIDRIQSPTYLSYTYYYNVKRSKNKALSTKRIEEKKVEAFLIDYARKYLVLSSQLQEWAKKYLQLAKDNEDNKRIEIQKAQQQELEITDKRLKKLQEMYLDEMIEKDEYQKQYDKFHKKKKSLQQEQMIMKSDDKELERIIYLASEFDKIIQKGSSEEKRGLILQLGSNLVWDEQNLRVYTPKWMKQYIKARKYMMSHIELFEPENIGKNIGQKSSFGPACPTLLGYWSTIRTSFKIYQKVKNNIT